MPSNITSPASIAPVISLSTSTLASLTRCITMRMVSNSNFAKVSRSHVNIVRGEGIIMAKTRSAKDANMLAMALVGYELERKRIDEKIQEIRSQLGPRQTITITQAAQAPKRKLSVAARRRIAAAQK